ncbi:DHH family phosphoesterase [Dietzia psychralcaliphila]|uniref:Phosphoesterase n=1 Tax=Dietzia psychralcaliphila TaxID=139021 RepID=A0AAD0JPY0_9ACTN|nr:DHH family phosphoesterase [Dietzia psychralcaliphila]AWH95645.1 phosphoesterase [Dietzia psychralcaliphila]PTM88592.1 phosphoesterase RecJ-like protein [Dietzia psychralcaliphila]
MITVVDAGGAAEVLARHREVTVLCHVRPDADALGSSAGLARALRAAGARVHHSFDPGIVPEALRVIPGTEHVVPVSEVPEHDGLVVTLDCASPDRVGDWGRLARSAAEILVVDHHRSNPGFGTHLLLDPEAASTASLVLDVLVAGRYPVDPELATSLYAGLVTDTGSFRWGGAGSHDTARRLLAAGAESGELGFALLDAHSFSWLRVLGELLGTARLDADAAGGRGAVWLTVPHDVVAVVDEADVESLVSHLQGVREAHVAVLVKEIRPGECAVSLRSRGDDGVDVSAVAAAFGGGGHPAAAGCTVRGDLGDVTARLRELLG